MGPELPFSEHLHSTKYRGPEESFKESANRIAGALEDSDKHFRAFQLFSTHQTIPHKQEFMELGLLELQMDLMDQRLEIVFSCALGLLSHL